MKVGIISSVIVRRLLLIWGDGRMVRMKMVIGGGCGGESS